MHGCTHGQASSVVPTAAKNAKHARICGCTVAHMVRGVVPSGQQLRMLSMHGSVDGRDKCTERGAVSSGQQLRMLSMHGSVDGRDGEQCRPDSS